MRGAGVPSLAALVIIASVVIVSAAAWASKDLRRALILSPSRVRERFEVYRLLTAGWLHADAAHLIFNMLSFYFFADEVERALGTLRFVILYLTAVVVSFVPTTLRFMRDPKYASLGASGAVSAVLFSAILLYPQLKLSLMFVPVAVPGWAYGIGYLAYSAWRSYRARDGINHDAHFSGAVYGALLTYVLEPARVTSTLHHLFS